MEQQDQILGQLQVELRAERGRHQETSKQLHAGKKTCTALEEDVEAYQRQLREFADKVKTEAFNKNLVCFFLCFMLSLY